MCETPGVCKHLAEIMASRGPIIAFRFLMSRFTMPCQGRGREEAMVSYLSLGLPTYHLDNVDNGPDGSRMHVEI